MKPTTSRNIGILLICGSLIFAIVLLLFQTDVFELTTNQPNAVNEKRPELVIVYPLDNTLFPPEIASPVFKWYGNSAGTTNWFVEVSASGKEIYSAYVFEPRWQPDSLVWQLVKERSRFDKIKFSVTCQIEKDSTTSPLSTSMTFQFSPDSVAAPLFFRKLDLPFKIASEHLSAVEWCLGDISNYHQAKTLLTGVNMCGNCHSFSADGSVMGIDFDYRNDRGGYATTNIEEVTRIDKNSFFSWNRVSRGGHSSSGFISSLSPDGRYVVSTINDQAVSSFYENEFRFFPIKGVLGILDRWSGESYELEGANDSLFVQCNATWSPDGKTILFAKTSRLTADEMNDPEIMKELTAGKRMVRFDLYSIPFNNGKGGIAKPITGASGNGESNYFPRVSPDGKWIVFTQAHAFMLRQLDSKLMIMPFSGGTPRSLESNMSIMNSWHSWSPNSKWIAFSTKGFSPYTKIVLTHIDESGHASPAVLLENLLNDTKAVNLPEFVNIRYNHWKSIQLDFLQPLIIAEIDINDVTDGVFTGSSMLNESQLKIVSAILEISVRKGKIEKISLKESVGIAETEQGILKRIVQLQSIDVKQLDVKSTGELVLIKAVEQGLMKGFIK